MNELRQQYLGTKSLRLPRPVALSLRVGQLHLTKHSVQGANQEESLWSNARRSSCPHPFTRSEAPQEGMALVVAVQRTSRVPKRSVTECAKDEPAASFG